MISQEDNLERNKKCFRLNSKKNIFKEKGNKVDVKLKKIEKYSLKFIGNNRLKNIRRFWMSREMRGC